MNKFLATLATLSAFAAVVLWAAAIWTENKVMVDNLAVSGLLALGVAVGFFLAGAET